MNEWQEDIGYPFLEDFVAGSLASVLVDRNEPDLLPVGHNQSIIDELMTGSQCQSDSVQALDLWGADNWGHFWRRHLTYRYLIIRLLKGFFGSNKAYRRFQ
ncbi:hypothetical protein BDR05DRAFT_995768 [Suillus weaverae]|nr:hypothetical protein BDR05DRAFT_995768 [Suillus weaverae]